MTEEHKLSFSGLNKLHSANYPLSLGGVLKDGMSLDLLNWCLMRLWWGQRQSVTPCWATGEQSLVKSNCHEQAATVSFSPTAGWGTAAGTTWDHTERGDQHRVTHSDTESRYVSEEKNKTRQTWFILGNPQQCQLSHMSGGMEKHPELFLSFRSCFFHVSF